MQTQISGSAHQANAILGAWHSGDATRLREELDRVPGLQAIDAGEQERLELLSEIACQMSRRESVSDDPVYGFLLEHLASFPSRQHQITQSSGYGRAAAAAALQ